MNSHSLLRSVMLSNPHKAIEYAIKRPKIVATFHKNTKVQDDGCIVWTKKTNQNGYSRICIVIRDESNKAIRVPVYGHRFAWALKFGIEALPMAPENSKKGDRLVLNHMCHNRLCVNTNHLEVILGSVNTSTQKRKPRKPNDAIIADNLEDFMEQIRNTDNE